MWPLLLVFASPHIVSAVLTRLNLSSSDVSSGRAVFTPPYDYDSHITASAVTSPSYYTPAMHYHQYEVPKYQHGHTGELCAWGNSFMDQVLQIAAAKLSLLGLVKTAITAVGAGFITKLPLILFKLIALPVGLVVLVLPLLLPFLLPILAMFIPIPVISHQGHEDEVCTDSSSECGSSGQRDTSRNVEGRVSRALKTLLNSEACVGKLACELGTLNSQSEYKKTVSWLLGHMQRLAPKGVTTIITAYRTAYVRGSDGGSCDGGHYRCDVERLIDNVYDDTET